MKTIKQIADEVGVSKQAVHQKRKDKELSAALQPFTSAVNGVIYISADGERLIKQAFLAVERRRIDAKKPPTGDGSVDAIIAILKTELDMKNEQIKNLNARLAETTAALTSAQRAVHAAQALHAGTMQKLLAAPTSIKERIFGKTAR
jgi:predicted DNA binding protein